MDSDLNLQLFPAASAKDIEGVKKALAAGASPTITATIKGVPFKLIIFAAAGGDAGVIEALLGAGADIEARDATGMTPLLTAANMGHAEVVRLLIASGANKEAGEYQQGLRAIHLAAIMGRDAVVSELLRAGADKDALDSDGSSALHYAATDGHDRVVELLLAAGANRNVMLHGETPLSTAEHYGHQSTAEILKGW
jgi:ankyrin repeat protein